MPVKVLRDGQPVDATVTLIERLGSPRRGEFEDKAFGLTVREITTDLRVVLNLGGCSVIVRREIGFPGAVARWRRASSS